MDRQQLHLSQFWLLAHIHSVLKDYCLAIGNLPCILTIWFKELHHVSTYFKIVPVYLQQMY